MSYEFLEPSLRDYATNPERGNGGRDEAKEAQVTDAFRAKYGTESNEPAHLWDERAKSDPDLGRMREAHQAKVVIPDGLGDGAQVGIEALRRQWGGEFDENYRAASEAISALPQDQLEAVHESYQGIADDPDIMAVLAFAGRGKLAELSPTLLQKLEGRYPGIADDERVKNLVESLKVFQK